LDKFLSQSGEPNLVVKKIMDEIRSAGNVIIVIDELHTLIGAGAAEGAIDKLQANELHQPVSFFLQHEPLTTIPLAFHNNNVQSFL